MNAAHQARDSLAEWLQWSSDMGVDCSLDDEPHSHLREPAAETADAVPSGAPSGQSKLALQPSSGAAHSASIAANCETLADILAALEAFDGCSLRETATQLCLCDGNPEADIMLIGEAPGAHEDRQGKPFVGPSGKLLDKALACIDLDRTKVFITNAVFWRPPGNRAPTSDELAICQPFLERLIELVQPKFILFLGKTAAATLLGATEGVTRLRGKPSSYVNSNLSESIPSLVTFHPAYLLRQPIQKRFVWRDLMSMKNAQEQLRSAKIESDRRS